MAGFLSAMDHGVSLPVCKSRAFVFNDGLLYGQNLRLDAVGNTLGLHDDEDHHRTHWGSQSWKKSPRCAWRRRNLCSYLLNIILIDGLEKAGVF